MPTIQRIPEVFLPMFDLDVLNQGSKPYCVGMACAGMKQFNELKEKTYRVFDGEWLYNECKKIDGVPGLRGTYFRAGLAVLKTVGAKPTNLDEDPSTYRIKAYAKVDDMTFEGLKKAIALYGVVLAGFRGSNGGWRGEIIRPRREWEQEWGHATFLVGYEKDYIIGQNSWGEERHNKGLFKFPKTYLPFEAWVILLDAINEPQAPIKTGWVARSYLVLNDETTANLNVREEPGLVAAVLKTLPKGTVVKRFGTPMQWKDRYWWVQIIL
jgi:hypothetical protein